MANSLQFMEILSNPKYALLETEIIYFLFAIPNTKALSSQQTT